ncbi:MAG: GspH/FimT family pseudopilin [Steroidobacteraceae bacterium]
MSIKPKLRTRSRPMASPAPVKGFTLLELMLTITVAAVILGLGAPNMAEFIRNSRMTSSANDVLAALHMARTEAVKRRAWTVMCMSTDPNAATPTCTAAGRGWIVFVDDADPTMSDANDGNLVVDDDEAILLRHDTVPDTITPLTAPNANRGYIAFTSSGFSRTVAAGTPLTSIRLCDSRGNTTIYGADNSAARAITISQTGRPQVTRLVDDITALGGC